MRLLRNWFEEGAEWFWGSHLSPHALGAAGDAAGLLGLDRLPLGQVVGRVLLVLCVVGQGGLLWENTRALQ